MPVETTPIDGLVILRWPTHDDDRGFFRQTYQLSELEQALGRTIQLVQGNHARSAPNVLRGFHAEPWDKLLYVTSGTVMCAVADIRVDSPTFGTAHTVVLGDPPGERLRVFISEGLANSYANIGNGLADVTYEVSQPWQPVDKRAIAWNDPDLAVAWPLASPLLSAEDQHNPTLRQRFQSHPKFTGSAPH